MRYSMFAMACLLGATIAGAASAESAASLVGTWRATAPAEDADVEAYLTFGADGQFCVEERSSASARQAYSGRYRIADEQLFLEATAPEAQTSDPLLTFESENRVTLLYIDGVEMQLARVAGVHACAGGAPSNLPPYSSP
ncbi:MAG TPA: hypothetical protein PLK37_06990 [Terricaulis sp.]|nr:hypothetical protein [Terricaulis sp.]